MNASAFPIPISVLSGFLGAGKTTLLNRLLREPGLADTAVVVNEWGEVAIDHLLIERVAGGGVIELADGCLCCAVRGELVDTLAELAERVRTGEASLKRVVVETSGLADPAPVLQSLMEHPLLVQAFRLDGVVTVVDALHGEASLDSHVEARAQAAVADRLVLSKTDLADAGTVGRLTDRLGRLNPRAEILRAEDRPSASLLSAGLMDPQTRQADLARWLGENAAHDHAHGDAERGYEGRGDAEDGHGHGHGTHDEASHHGDHDLRHEGGVEATLHYDRAGHRHDTGITSFSLRHEGALPFAAIETFLDLLRSVQGEGLLRMKGVVELTEEPSRPLVLHGVRRSLHPPAWLPEWPPGPRGTRLVLIGDRLDEDYVRRLFTAVTDRPRIDTPDRAALTDNPLAIAGFGG